MYTIFELFLKMASQKTLLICMQWNCSVGSKIRDYLTLSDFLNLFEVISRHEAFIISM